MTKIGDEVVWYGNLDDPESARYGTVTKLSRDLVFVDNYHKAEDCIFEAYVWPKQYADELQGIVKQRAKLKKAYDDSVGLIYQLRNKVVREQKP